jgi:predicted ATPase
MESKDTSSYPQSGISNATLRINRRLCSCGCLNYTAVVSGDHWGGSLSFGFSGHQSGIRPGNTRSGIAGHRLDTSGAEPEALTLDICGHAVRVPLHAQGIARFTYRELCVAPLGASDYIAFANRFHTLIIDCIPLNFVHRNHVKRLCTLIDVLDERRVKLIVSAEAEPRDLCRGMIAVLRPAIGLPRYQSETSPDMLEITRTVSRLVGMRSRDYLALSKNGAI